MNSIPCDIVLIPEDSVSKAAIDLSNSLRRHGTLFTLKEDEYFPHLSLYMAQLKVDDLPEVESILKNIADSQTTVSLQPNEYHQEGGYIDIDYQKTDSMSALQMTVIDSLNHIRDGLRQKDKDRLASAGGRERDNIERYGYRSVGDLFEPHLTITRFKDPSPLNTASLADVHTFNASFVKLGIFEMGDNGTCVRKIAEFKLKA